MAAAAPFSAAMSYLYVHRPVVRHGPAAEERLVLRRVARVVHQHDDGLAGDVHVLVVVPAVFGRDDAVADEDEVAVLHRDARLHALRLRDEVALPLQRDAAAVYRQRRRNARRDADQRYVLDVGAVRVAGREANGPELGLEVAHRALLAGRAWQPALHRVVRQHRNALQQALRREMRQRRLHVLHRDGCVQCGAVGCSAAAEHQAEGRQQSCDPLHLPQCSLRVACVWSPLQCRRSRTGAPLDGGDREGTPPSGSPVPVGRRTAGARKRHSGRR
jgi:hypothetical protein